MSQQTYTTVGSHSFTVPANVEKVVVEAWGAEGGPGGGTSGTTPGGYTKATFAVSSGETLDIEVGGQGGAGTSTDAGSNVALGGSGGSPDGGDGGSADTGGASTHHGGGGGGGSSRVSIAGTLSAVGAGGGGGGGNATNGGQGGSNTGQDGGDAPDAATGGTGGTQSSGGSGGADDGFDSGPGGDATGSSGGGGGFGENATHTRGGGGGGGGYYGGGGGGGSTPASNTAGGAGGGGGSNFLAGSASSTTSTRGVSAANGGDGKVVLTYFTETDVQVDAVSDTTVDLSWTDLSSETEYRILRATSSGSTASDYTTVTEVAADTTSYTDTGLTQGQEYFYRIEAVFSDGTSLSNEVSPTTTLPAPTLDSVTVQNDDDVAVGWTNNATDHDGVRVQASRDGGSSWTTVADLAPSSTSYTDTGKLDGEQYDYRVQAYTVDATSNSGSQTVQTVLPDVANLMLDASVEDELTATCDDTQDYGNYRFEIKESDTATWTTSATEPESSTSHTFGGLKDGEKYDVRLRGETEHTTTAWLELSDITLLPAPTNFDVGTVSPRRTYPAPFTWTDNAQNTEGNYAVLISTDGGATFTEVASLSDTAENYDYTASQPDTTITAKVRFETQYVTADSGTASFISGLEPESGAWVGLRRGDGTQRKIGADLQHLNAIREHTALSDWVVKTAYDTSLEDWVFSEAWLYNGEEFLLRGELQTIESSDGRGLLTTISGYDELVVLTRDDVDVTYQNQLAWKAAEDFIDTETSFTPDVTEPSTMSTAEALQDVDGASALQAAAVNVAADDPVIYNATQDRIEQAESGFVLEAEDGSWSSGWTGQISDAAYSAGGGVSTGDFPGAGSGLEVTFTTEYDIPVSELSVQVAAEYPDGNGGNDSPAHEVYLDGTLIHSESENVRAAGDPTWTSKNNSISNLGSTLAAGTHTLRYEIASTPGDGTNHTQLDAFAVADLRFDKTEVGGGFADAQTDDFDWVLEDGYTKYPEAYGNGVQVFFEEVAGAYNLLDVDVATTWGAASRAEFGVTFDSGTTTTSVTGTDSTNLSNTAGPTTSVQFFLVLNRYDDDAGSETAAPTAGDGTSYCFDFQVTGNGNTRGFIEDQQFTGEAFDVLQNLLDRAGMRCVLEYAEAGTSTLAAFRAGDVTGSADFVVGEGGRTRKVDGGGYRNRVTVRGAKDANGTRPSVTIPEDPSTDAEIQALANELGVSTQEATFDASITRPDLTDLEELKSFARTVRDRLIGEDDLTGRLRVAPVMVEPGKSYTIPAWNDTQPSEQVVYDLGADGVQGSIVFDDPAGLGADLDRTAGREQETRDSI